MTHFTSFYVPWAAALAVSAAEPAATAAVTVLRFEGMSFPAVQSVLAVAGVLMARPLARKNESTLPLWQFLLVSLIMLVLALIWVAEASPSVLFTFVVAIGLGFSGYAAVEAAGDQIQDFVKRIMSTVSGVLGSIGVKK